MKILCLFPINGNGGISSWSRKFIKTFPDSNYIIRVVDNGPGKRFGTEGVLERISSGIKALFRIKKEIQKEIKTFSPDILHTTSSGDLGALRDCIVGKICKKHGIKSILHNRYGCIPEDFCRKDLVGYLVRKSFSLFDQIWVLDQRTFDFLKKNPKTKDKVFLTPNSIEIKEELDNSHKEYSRVGFIGNLIPSKGIFELVEACTNCDVRLDIIGPGAEDVINRIKEIASNKLNKTIYLHGKLPNDEAVKFIKDIDIIALPTYYTWEAFPISILEAMSNSKMVISCPRAAIPDMLTDLKGNKCGILVKPKSSDAIKDAIMWCQNNKSLADSMCQAAYSKVWNSYRTDIIYEIYRNNYNSLLQK